LYCITIVSNHSKDKLSLFTSSVNLEDIGDVDFKKSGLLFYTMILGSHVKNDLNEIRRYIDIYF
jgi:hypothetical protein